MKAKKDIFAVTIKYNKYFFLFDYIYIKALQKQNFTMRSAIMSNQKIIDEIDAVRDNFIHSRPEMMMSVFKSTRKGDGRTNKLDHAVSRPIFKDDRGGGSSAFQKHPLGYQPPGGSTATADPLFSGVVDRPVPRGGRHMRGSAMLKAPLPLTGEDSESDEEGAGYLNGYSSSDDEDDYDDGAGFVKDSAKKAYGALSKKTHDAIAKLAPYAKEISKKLTSPMALKIGASGLSILLMALASNYVGPYVSKAIMPAITAKVFQISADVSEGIMSLATAKKEVKKAADEAKERMHEPSEERTERTYVPEGVEEEEASGLRRFGKRKAVAVFSKGKTGGKINKIVGTKRGETVRGALIAEYMKKHKVPLGVASKKVKELGLY